MVRFKNRYILFEIVYDEDEEKKINVNYSIISKAIKTSIEQNFGAYGIGIIQSSFTSNFYKIKLYFNFKKKKKNFIKIFIIL